MAGMYGAITQTTLDTAAGSGDTTLLVDDASGFPPAGATCRAYLVAVIPSSGGGGHRVRSGHRGRPDGLPE